MLLLIRAILQRLEETSAQASKRLISVLLSTLRSVGQWAPEYSDLRQAAEGLGRKLIKIFIEERRVVTITISDSLVIGWGGEVGFERVLERCCF